MRRSYEFKQESHTMQEQRSWNTYSKPSYEQYYDVQPPPSMQKVLVNNPLISSSFHYEPSDDENDNQYQQVVVHDGRRAHYGHHGTRSQYGSSYQFEAKKNNRHEGGILRPPLGYVSRPQMVVDQEVNSHQNGWHYREPVSRINNNNNNNNNNNRFIEDYSRKKLHNYGGENDDHDYYDYGETMNEGNLESLIKRLGGMEKVKKIEVIEYERTTYRGGRQEWKVLSNGSIPNNRAPWVKGF
ncbi:unnamed protein product [Amaranthus hypochondriacus]